MAQGLQGIEGVDVGAGSQGGFGENIKEMEGVSEEKGEVGQIESGLGGPGGQGSLLEADM